MVGNVVMSKYKNIIFDLGGVIINLDMPLTIRKFEELGIPDFHKIYGQLAQTDVFDRFDKGFISEEEFFNGFMEQFHPKCGMNELIDAWNAMLLDFPKKRLDDLMFYKEGYRTFLLSNTNTTHVKAFEEILYRSHGVKDLSGFFERTYYSCDMGMRKPDREIFEHVLNENDLDPNETIFIDDTIIHVNGAQTLGINAILLPKGEEFRDLLAPLLE